jgi:phosphate transport system substrate-binding protein
MHRIRRSVALVICAAVLGPAAGFAAAKTIISLSGSTSVYPLAVALATKYNKLYDVGFRIFQGGSDIGVNDVAHGRVTIGDASRDPLPSDPSGLYWYKIARDAVCVITNPANPISNLSQAEVQSIFDGSVTNWANVPGAGVTGAIDLVSRTSASGTADAFKQIFLGQTVHADPNAIGYVSLDFIAGTYPVPYKGVACTLRNAKAGSYPGVRNFWMITRGRATGAAKKFILWVQHSSAANQIVGTNWIPLH